MNLVFKYPKSNELSMNVFFVGTAKGDVKIIDMKQLRARAAYQKRKLLSNRPAF